MLLDLINPHKTYKCFLSDAERKSKSSVLKDESGSSSAVFNGPQDDLNKLVAGDKIFYENVNKFPRWLEAVFIKRISDNVFQILVGKHKTNAHRRQLKAAYEPKRSRTVVQLPTTTMNKRKRESIDEDEDFYGFSDVPRPEDVSQRKKAKHARSPINTRSRTT